MKAQYFAYTRNLNVDYKTIIVPSDDFCPKDTRKFFLNQIRGLINVEQYDDPLDKPRWLFSKVGRYILFGTGVNNATLNKDCYKDFAGRPVRGFFGIVIDSADEDVILPYDITFFQQFYSNYILPLWEQGREDFIKHSVEVTSDLSGYHCVYKSGIEIQLNYSQDKSVILGNVGIEDCLSSALYAIEDTSITIGFSNKNHAFAKDYMYLNSIVIGVPNREERTYKREKEEERKEETGSVELDQKNGLPKKALGPKVIMISVIVLILLILFGVIRKLRNIPSDQEIQKKENLMISDSLTFDSKNYRNMQK